MRSNIEASTRAGGVRSWAAVAIATCMLIGAGWLGTASARSSAITDPTVITLHDQGEARGHFYPVKNEDGKKTGGLGMFQNGLLDDDGEVVGHVRDQCANAKGLDWICTMVITLEDGTIVTEGTFGGFQGEELAVLGGTGAYDNVRGYLVLGSDADGGTRTLHLTP